MGKAKTVLMPGYTCKEVNMRLYSKALRSLQEAISNEATSADAEVLCATQLLSLHEVLLFTYVRVPS